MWSIVSFVFIFCNTHILDSTNVANTSRSSNLTLLCQPFRIYNENSPYYKLELSWNFSFMIVAFFTGVIKEGWECYSYPFKKFYWKKLENLGQWIVHLSVLTVWVVTLIRQSGKYEKYILGVLSLRSEYNFTWEVLFPGIYVVSFNIWIILASISCMFPFYKTVSYFNIIGWLVCVRSFDSKSIVQNGETRHLQRDVCKRIQKYSGISAYLFTPTFGISYDIPYSNARSKCYMYSCSVCVNEMLYSIII